jgi:flagella basal body P-ring formation protein FlgA
MLLPAAELARALMLVQQAAVQLAPPGARILAMPGTPDARLKLAPCARVEPFLPPAVPAWGRTRAGLRCAEGPVAWTVYLPVTVQAWAPAWTPVAPLPAGHVLAEGDLVPVETDWAARSEAPLPSLAAALGRTLARPAMPGQALRQGDLRRRQWFASGDTVQVVVSGPGYSITGEGLALADGLDGQRSRVQMLVRDPTGVVYSGRVVNALAIGDRGLAWGSHSAPP